LNDSININLLKVEDNRVLDFVLDVAAATLLSNLGNSRLIKAGGHANEPERNRNQLKSVPAAGIGIPGNQQEIKGKECAAKGPSLSKPGLHLQQGKRLLRQAMVFASWHIP
jgi:hypothetical protein